MKPIKAGPGEAAEPELCRTGRIYAGASRGPSSPPNSCCRTHGISLPSAGPRRADAYDTRDRPDEARGRRSTTWGDPCGLRGSLWEYGAPLDALRAPPRVARSLRRCDTRRHGGCLPSRRGRRGSVPIRCRFDSCAVTPVHGIGLEALRTLRLFRTAAQVLARMTPGAHQIAELHDAPCLRLAAAHLQVFAGDAYMHVVDVEQQPALTLVLQDSIPLTPAQATLLSELAAAARPADRSHEPYSFSSVAPSRTSTRMAACGTTRYRVPSNVISTAALRKKSA